MANGTIAASQLEMESLSGTGIITITPPATNTNRAITLPDAAGQVVLNSATQTLTNKTIQGSTIQGGAITLATAVTASGTSVDFTGIPSWVKRITVMLQSVTLSGVAHILIQVGNNTPTTSGYAGASTYVIGGSSSGSATSTAGMIVFSGSASNVNVDQLTLTLVTGNTWISSHNGTMTNLALSVNGGSVVTLPAVLNMLRVTTVNATDTFTGGTINIMYEG